MYVEWSASQVLPQTLDCCKGLLSKNTLAYLSGASVTKKTSFIKFAAGEARQKVQQVSNVINLFFFTFSQML